MKVSIDVPELQMGLKANPASARQRVHAACKAMLERGEYPSVERLKEVVPGTRPATIDNYRREVFRLVGLGPNSYGKTIEIDLSQL